MIVMLAILLAFGLFWMLFPEIPGMASRPFSRLLKHIWKPETNRVSKETIERLKELYVDSDVPAETAALITCREEGISEEELLAAFNAIDAQDLMSIITSGNKSKLLALMRMAKKIKKEL